jgi:hypothetical protein
VKRIFRPLLNFVCFGIGFGMATATIFHSVPTPPISQVTPKLDWLKAHAADYDVLFVGSSRMRQLKPDLFNQACAGAGWPVRAFNLGVDGVRPPEDSYILEQALKGRTAPLRFVLVEGNSIAMRISEEDAGSDRMTYWHDSARMAVIWERTWSRELGKNQSVRELMIEVWRNFEFVPGHVRHWLANSTRAGRGSDLFHRFVGLRVEPKRMAEALGPARDGFITGSSIPMDASDSGDYTKSLDKMQRREKARLDPADTASQAHFNRMSALVRAHGAQLVIIAPPTLTPEVFQPLSPDILFLNFSDPVKYPQLFDAAVRLNSSHTNEAGSKLFTSLVAEGLIAALSKQSAPMRSGQEHSP